MAFIHRLSIRLAAFLFILRWRLRLLKCIVSDSARHARSALKLYPIAGAAPDGEGDGDGDGDADGDKDGDGAAPDGEGDGDGDGDADGDKDGDGDGDGKPAGTQEPNWKQQSRKHERDAKKARTEADKLRQQLKDREDADKSEHEKELEQARDEARNELNTEHEKERRQDRLEVAATKAAARGVKIGTGDDAKRVKFADPDDALLHLERDIRNGDLDEDDIFDDKGKIRADQLEEALADLLDRKPHLKADADGKKGTPRVNGSADGGKGKPAEGDQTVDDHFKKIRRHNSGQGAKAV